MYTTSDITASPADTYSKTTPEPTRIPDPPRLLNICQGNFIHVRDVSFKLIGKRNIKEWNKDRDGKPAVSGSKENG